MFLDIDGNCSNWEASQMGVYNLVITVFQAGVMFFSSSLTLGDPFTTFSVQIYDHSPLFHVLTLIFGLHSVAMFGVLMFFSSSTFIPLAERMLLIA